ncbi:SICAvar, type I (fragment), partial [Plasmodium knowlesi strain H]
MSGGSSGGGGGGELLQKWLEGKVKAAADATAQPGHSVDATAEAEKITEELKKDFEEAWRKLQASLAEAEAREINTFCGTQVALAVEGAEDRKNWHGRNEYVKDLCKGLMGIRYFMSGIKELGGGSRNVEIERNITEYQWLARCTVGMLALSEIYGDHCKLDKVISYVTPKVEENLKKYLKNSNDQAMIEKCEGKVDATALMIGRAVLGDQIKQWADVERRKGKNERAWRLGQLWQDKWKSVCPQEGGEITEEGKKKELKENARSMTKLMSLDNNNQNKNGVMPLSDVLIGESEDYSLDLNKLTEVFKKALENTGTSGSTSNVNVAGAIMKEITKQSDEKLG